MIDVEPISWKAIFRGWPLGVKPSFLNYEDLFADPATLKEIVKFNILSPLGISMEGWERTFLCPTIH